MSRDKQMINDLIEIFDEEYGKRNLITPHNTADKLTAKGYRKASDVAEEIFAELDTFIVTKVIDHGTLKYDIGDKYKALKQKYSVALPTIAELKKKYTESEKENGKI